MNAEGNPLVTISAIPNINPITIVVKVSIFKTAESVFVVCTMISTLSLVSIFPCFISSFFISPLPFINMIPIIIINSTTKANTHI